MYTVESAQAVIDQFRSNVEAAKGDALQRDFVELITKSDADGLGTELLRDFILKNIAGLVKAQIPVGSPLPQHQTRVTATQAASGQWGVNILISPIKTSPLKNFEFRFRGMAADMTNSQLIDFFTDSYASILKNLMVQINLEKVNEVLAEAGSAENADLPYSISLIPAIEATTSGYVESISDTEIVLVADNDAALKELYLTVELLETVEGEELPEGEAGRRELVAKRKMDAQADLIEALSALARPIDLLAAKPKLIKLLTGIGLDKVPSLVRKSTHRKIDGVKSSITKADVDALVDDGDVMGIVHRVGATGEISVVLSAFNKATLEPATDFDMVAYAKSKIA